MESHYETILPFETIPPLKKFPPTFKIPKDSLERSLQRNPQLKYWLFYYGLEMKYLFKRCVMGAYYQADGTILEGSRNFRR